MDMYVDMAIDTDMTVYFGKPSFHQYVLVSSAITLIH